MADVLMGRAGASAIGAACLLALGCYDYEVPTRCASVPITEQLMNLPYVQGDQVVSSSAAVTVEDGAVLTAFGSNDGSVGRIGVALLDKFGNPVPTCGGEGALLLSPGVEEQGEVVQPSIAHLPDSPLVAVVYGMRSEPDTALDLVQFRYLDPSGCPNLESPPLTLAEAQNAEHLLPARVVALRSNLQLVVWPVLNSARTSPVKAQLIEASSWQPKALLEAPVTLVHDGWVDEVAVAATSVEKDVGALVALKHTRTNDAARQVLLVSANADLKVGAEIAISELGAGEASYGIALAVDDEQGLLVWADGESDARVRGRFFEWKPTLRPLGAILTLAEGLYEVTDVAVARTGRGRYLAAWSASDDGKSGRVYWRPLSTGTGLLTARSLAKTGCSRGPIELPLTGTGSAPIRRFSLTVSQEEVQCVYTKEIRNEGADRSGSSVWGFRIDAAAIVPR